MQYLKRATAGNETGAGQGFGADAAAEAIRASVAAMLADIRGRGEVAVREYAARFDHWTGDFILSDAKRAALIALVPRTVRDDIRFAHEQVRRFAEAQRDSLRPFEIQTEPGVMLGQRLVPLACAGCYVPGGRYAHAASAIMSIATAKVAGVGFIVACSPPRGESIDPAVVFAMDLAGADVILEMGKEVHAIEIKASKTLNSGDLRGLKSFREYYGRPHRPWVLSELADQQVAAGVMWVPGSLAYTVAIIVFVYRWLEPEASARRLGLAGGG